MTKAFNLLKGVNLDDQTVTTGGGGSFEYVPPAEGMARARLVGYIELGKHEKSFQGQTKVVEMVRLEFELSGKKWEPKVLDDGRVLPQKFSVTETLSTNSKARYAALFSKMREGRKDVVHMAQLVGEPFIIELVHNKSEDGKQVYVNAMRDKAWLIGPPVVRSPVLEDGEPTGEFVNKPVKVAEMISEPRVFLFHQATKEQWDSIFIARGDGEKSKNFLQDKIRSALNFSGSMAEVVADGPVTTADEEYEEDDIPEFTPASKTAPVDDEEDLLADID